MNILIFRIALQNIIRTIQSNRITYVVGAFDGDAIADAVGAGVLE